LNFKFEVLTANEWGGVAFAMALIVHSKKGYVLIKKIYKWKTWKKKRVQIDDYQIEDSSVMSDNDNNWIEEDDSNAVTMKLLKITTG